MPRLSHAHIVVDSVAGILEDTYSQSPPKIAASVNWNGDRQSSSIVPKRKMTARLAIVGEALLPQKTHQFRSRNLRHPAQSGTPTVSSSTWTSLSC